MSYNLVDPTTGDLTRVAGGTLYADLPIGSWIKNDMDTLPSGFLKEGDAISQSEYPELYAKYGSTVPYKADTSELSDYSTPITFEQITTGYTMPYDGVLNIGANSTAGSTIAYVTVNGVNVVNLGTTSYTGTFVRFRKGDLVKANNIVSNNYVLKVAYYKKSLIVKAKHVAVPADFMNAVVETNSYSTDETVVGRWIDGKPIYRKVIVSTFGLSPGSSKTLTLSNFGVNNVETPISSTIISSDGGYLGVRNVNVLTSFKTTVVDIVITSSGYSLGSGEQKIILEYTKTTDA